VGLVDVKNGVLTYASAGHEPALLFATPTRHDHLHPTGPILGLGGLKRCGFTERTFRWSDRSVLVAVTDGITEARRYESGRPKFFGSFAVARAFINAHRAQVDPARAIGEAAREHANGHARDDATVLVVRSDRRESARSLPR
jgi:serine phosphatase RsbU (regulator of sigma subunit)